MGWHWQQGARRHPVASAPPPPSPCPTCAARAPNGSAAEAASRDASTRQHVRPAAAPAPRRPQTMYPREHGEVARMPSCWPKIGWQKPRKRFKLRMFCTGEGKQGEFEGWERGGKGGGVCRWVGAQLPGGARARARAKNPALRQGTARAVGLFVCVGQSASGAHGRRFLIELF